MASTDWQTDRQTGNRGMVTASAHRIRKSQSHTFFSLYHIFSLMYVWDGGAAMWKWSVLKEIPICLTVRKAAPFFPLFYSVNYLFPVAQGHAPHHPTKPLLIPDEFLSSPSYDSTIFPPASYPGWNIALKMRLMMTYHKGKLVFVCMSYRLLEQPRVTGAL